MLGFMVTIGGVLAVLLTLAAQSLSTVIIYVVFALFAALGLDPLVRFMVRRGLKRAWGIVIVAIGLAGVVAGALTVLLPTIVEQVAQFVESLPGEVADFRESSTYAWLTDAFGTSISDLTNQAQAFLTDPDNLVNIGGGVVQAGTAVVSGISGTVIVIVLTLYFLASLPTIKRAFVRMAPARNRNRVGDLTDQITHSIGGYLVGMVILAALNATFSLILFLVLGLPFAALMAMLAFLITLIPMIGSVLFWVAASLLALATSPGSAIIFAVVYLIYMQVEAYVLTPRVMNRTIAIPGALVVIGALVGGTLLGLLGALIAIPVSAALLLIYQQVIQPKQDAKT